jgi:hypothetical protein
MSGERKSIVINADSLLGGGGAGGGGGGGGGARRHTKRNGARGERKLRPSSIVQPSTLKKTLLERIKQHQRTRERAREHVQEPESPSPSQSITGGSTGGDTDTFSQSMDFLRKLAMKRRQQQQHTQKHRSIPLPEAKTPEAKMLNQVAETLHNGEILTNTGLLGLPVVPTLIPNSSVSEPLASSSVAISTSPMPMPMPSPVISLGQMTSQETPASLPPPVPKISELAEMYNNTIASAPVVAEDTATTTTTTTQSADSAPLHIPAKIEDFMPSIFLKEEPPHGCLKNGKKPTFREWATKMLGGGDKPSPAETPNNNESIGLTGGGDSEGSEMKPSEQLAGMRVKIRKTKKKSYRIGKHDDVVGVLLKNKQTQRHIQNQHLTLRQKTIGEIRKYLYEHQLLKVGSNAPPDVLRRMYEDSILTGDVKNTNKDVLLHNFMSGGVGE